MENSGIIDRYLKQANRWASYSSLLGNDIPFYEGSDININGNPIKQKELVKEEMLNLYKYYIMKLLRIQSHNMEEIPELVNILDSIIEFNPTIKEYNYSISFFDGSPKENFKESFVIFLKSINKNEKGLILNFNQLQESLLGLFQIYDLLLLIDNNTDKFEKSKIKEDSIMFSNLFLTITYFDGGFWELSATDGNLLKYLSDQFKSEIVF